MNCNDFFCQVNFSFTVVKFLCIGFDVCAMAVYVVLFNPNFVENEDRTYTIHNCLR